MPELSIDTLLTSHRLVIVGGVGGVGKTTLSAALALRAACLGRRVAVLTIDPARRLGAALGFRTLGNRLRRVPDRKLDPYRIKPGGSLSAAMLDAKATFDSMIGRYAPSSGVRDRILQNRFYDQLSRALSGTHEYMALEKIFELRALDEFDLLVLDTPPESALNDFWEAPARLQAFLDRDVVKWFFHSQKLGKGIAWALSLLDRLAGGTVLEDIAQLLTDFDTLLDGLRDRAKSVGKILQEKSTTFVVATSTDPLPWTRAQTMITSAQIAGIHPGAMILNRTVGRFSSESPDESSALRLLRRKAELLSMRQKRTVAAMHEAFPEIPIFKVPLLAKDPTTVETLVTLWNSGTHA